MAMIPALFVYLFKANISLALFCVIHYALLRRLTFVRGNRWFLLGGALCAVLLPLVPVDALLAKHEHLQQAVIYYLPVLPEPEPAGPQPWAIATVLFWAGVTVMAIRLIVQLVSLRRLHRSARRAEIAGYDVMALKKQVSPFSFFRNIYLNPELHAPQLLPGILRHEAVHVRQWHTVDIMLGSLVQVFAWFNPAAWLLQHAIRENLEFITDRTLLREGMNAQQYQFSLLEVNGIPTATAIANNFNFSSLKNRIKMMNKKRSPQYQVVRYTVPLVAAAALVLVLNASRAALMPVKDKIVQIAAPLLPAAQVTSAATDTTIQGKVIQSAPVVKRDTLRNMHVTGTATLTGSNAITADGNTITVTSNGDNEVRVIGLKTTADVKNDNALLVTNVRRDTSKIRLVVTNGTATATSAGVKDSSMVKLVMKKGKAQPLYFVDGVPVSPAELEQILPNDIESMNVLKGDNAVAVYGPGAINGVILIKMKKGAE